MGPEAQTNTGPPLSIRTLLQQTGSLSLRVIELLPAGVFANHLPGCLMRSQQHPVVAGLGTYT
ncbi:hypothetical protein TorRG33x02_264040 [Trema orientale]|uniref:Uncharacterized protein n=1 Tax=Trema orientale TaxID=63057 RepID=A0A2P5D309_TREOI|nr:hypothetical protein TorRG33x02_264040 [Trema orientale]